MSGDQKPRNVMIRMTGCSDGVVSGNIGLGYDSMVEQVDCLRIDVTDNLAMTPEVAKLFFDLQSAIQAAQVPPDSKAELLETVGEMQASVGGSGFIDSYAKFVATAKDHAELVSAIAPYLAPLGSLIAQGMA